MTKDDEGFIGHLAQKAAVQRCRETYNYGADRCDAWYGDDGFAKGECCGEPCDFIMHGDQDVTLRASEVRRLIALIRKGE